MSETPRPGRAGFWLGALLVAVILAAAGTLAAAHWLGPLCGYGAPQPISFSHRVHATDKQIDCAYCHPYAERSLVAGLPPVSKCLGCHAYVIPTHPEIRKLRAADERREEIAWVRVFAKPDHVFFPHYRHLGKGVACAECHGEVARQDRLIGRTFEMGFCLGCHKQRGASRECTACHQ